VTFRQAFGTAPVSRGRLAVALAVVCGLLAWLPLVGPIGLVFAIRSRPTMVVDRLGWRLLWSLAVILDVLGTGWTVLYLLAHYFLSGLI
jgi:hypothetical protein